MRIALIAPLVIVIGAAALSQRSLAADAPLSAEKWQVTHQLVQGMPWPGAKRPEAQLLADVKEAEPTGDQRLVFALSDLAAWYRAQGRLDDAEKTYRRVLSLQEKRGLANHHDIGIQHNDLGVVLTEAGKHPAAEGEFKASIQKWEKHWAMPMQTEDHAVTLHNYAVLLQKMGRGAEAKAMEDKGVKIMVERRKALGM